LYETNSGDTKPLEKDSLVLFNWIFYSIRKPFMIYVFRISGLDIAFPRPGKLE
jgi:hypothetical protein